MHKSAPFPKLPHVNSGIAVGWSILMILVAISILMSKLEVGVQSKDYRRKSAPISPEITQEI